MEHHPVLNAMMRSSCRNSLQIQTAFHSYMHLSEVRRLRKVSWHDDAGLNLVYLEAQVDAESKSRLYIPLPPAFQISPQWMRDSLPVLHNKHDGLEILLILPARDLGFVFYKVSEGLVMPPSVEETRRKKEKEEHRWKITQYIRRNKKHLPKAKLVTEVYDIDDEEEEEEEKDGDDIELISDRVAQSRDAKNDCMILEASDDSSCEIIEENANFPAGSSSMQQAEQKVIGPQVIMHKRSRSFHSDSTLASTSKKPKN